MAKACFDRVKVRSVRDILYAGNIHSLVDVLGIGSIMNPEIVHVEIEGLVVHLYCKVENIVREVLVAHSLVLYLQILEALLGRDTYHGGNIRKHQFALVNLNRVVLLTPSRSAHGLLAEAYLILVDYLLTFIRGISQLIKYSLPVHGEVHESLLRNSLVLADLLPLDSVSQIESPERSDSYLLVHELPVK